MKNCLFCGEPFEAQKPKQKFCSNKCRVYFNREDVSEGGIVYCLRNPLDDNNIFYVGKTIFSLNKRLAAHLHTSKKEDDKKSSIIKTILQAGEDVVIEQLEIISEDGIIATQNKLLERENYWIRHISETTSITNIVNNPNASRRKTNPIGVRFDIDTLEYLKNQKGVRTAQQALNFLTDYFNATRDMKITINLPGINNPELIEKTKAAHEKNKLLLKDAIPISNDFAEVENIGITSKEIEKQIQAIHDEKKPTLFTQKQFKIFQDRKIAELQKKVEELV